MEISTGLLERSGARSLAVGGKAETGAPNLEVDDDGTVRWSGRPAEGTGLVPVAGTGAVADPQLLAQATEDAARGRTTLARDGSVLAGYVGRDEGGRRWDGDWTNIPYPSFAPNDVIGLAQYLCQRVLDLTDPDNPTLTYSQKAALLALVNSWEEGKRISVGQLLERYLATGRLVESDFGGGIGLGSEENPLRDGKVFEGLQRVADKIAELEKAADLPNADMRDANALMRDLGLVGGSGPAGGGVAPSSPGTSRAGFQLGGFDAFLAALTARPV